jgi:predicted nucleic acid-binding protein
MRVVQDQVLLADLRRELDAGEAEPIALAVESDADLALIDERRGRMVAGRHGVRVLGLLGVLVAAKEQNLLRVIRPIMDRLTSDARFRISDDLYHRVLERAGELWMFPCSMLGCLGERQEGRQPLAAIRTRHHKAIAQTTVRLEYS